MIPLWLKIQILLKLAHFWEFKLHHMCSSARQKFILVLYPRQENWRPDQWKWICEDAVKESTRKTNSNIRGDGWGICCLPVSWITHEGEITMDENLFLEQQCKMLRCLPCISSYFFKTKELKECEKTICRISVNLISLANFLSTMLNIAEKW